MERTIKGESITIKANKIQRVRHVFIICLHYFVTGYVRYIEKELGRLKQENQKLQEMYVPTAKKPPVPTQSKQNKTEHPQVAQIIKAALGKHIAPLNQN